MKKAILFEPTLLAEVERESPDLYEFYRDCPISEMEFLDYGVPGYPFFIRKEIMDGLELIAELESINLTKILLASEIGYSNGMVDLISRLPEDHATRIKDRALLLELFDLVSNYCYYEIDSLFDENNYAKRGGLLYSKITYREAQYYIAWEAVLRRHEDFNGVFEGLNTLRKTRQLELDKIMNSGFHFN